MRMVSLRFTLSVTFVLAGSALSIAQQPSDGNSDWRDAASNALQEVDRHIESTTNLPKYKSNRFGIKTKDQVLKSWRDAGNSIRRKAVYITEKYGRALGWGAFLADGPAKALGHWSVGQYADGSVELANEGIKTFATTGGAYVGAGGVLAGMKMMGIGGMTIGGPAAGIIGAAIGGVIGAVGGGIIYDGYVSGYVQQVARGTIDLGRAGVRYLFDLPAERTSFEQAQDARHDFLVRQVVEQRERELRQMYGYEGTAEEEVLLTDRMTDPAKLLGNAAPDASKPVIPDACTLTLTTWLPKYPDARLTTVCRVESGIVTGTPQFPNSKGPAHELVHKERHTFTGKIEDNQITGAWIHNIYSEFEARGDDDIVDWIQTSDSTITVKAQMTLNLDGTLTGSTASSWKSSWSFRNTPPNSNLVPGKNSGSNKRETLSGCWKIGANRSE